MMDRRHFLGWATAAALAPSLPRPTQAAGEVERWSTVEAVTAHLPPYVMERGPAAGFCRELVRELDLLVGRAGPTRFMPWRRAQLMAATQPDMLVYPLTRVPEREHRFQWLVRLVESEGAFHTLDRPPPDTLAEARRFTLIGVQGGSVWDKYLTARGFEPILVRTDREGEQLARLLLSGRIHAWFTERSIAAWSLLQMGEKAAAGRPMFRYGTYLAGSLALPTGLVIAYRNAAQMLEKTGTTAEILGRYGRLPSLP